MGRFQNVQLVDGDTPGTFMVQFFDAKWDRVRTLRLMLAEAEHLDGLIANGATPETLDSFVYRIA